MGIFENRVQTANSSQPERRESNLPTPNHSRSASPQPAPSSGGMVFQPSVSIFDNGRSAASRAEAPVANTARPAPVAHNSNMNFQPSKSIFGGSRPVAEAPVAAAPPRPEIQATRAAEPAPSSNSGRMNFQPSRSIFESPRPAAASTPAATQPVEPPPAQRSEVRQSPAPQQGGAGIVTGNGAGVVRGGGDNYVRYGGGSDSIFENGRHGNHFGGPVFRAGVEADAGFVAGARLTLGPSRPPVCWEPTPSVFGGAHFGAHASGGALFSAGITSGSLWNAGCGPSYGSGSIFDRSCGLSSGQPPINYVSGIDYGCGNQYYATSPSWGVSAGIVAGPGYSCAPAVGGVYHKEWANGLFSFTAAWGAAAGPSYPTPGIWTCGLPNFRRGCGEGGVVYGNDGGIVYGGGGAGIVVGGPQNVVYGGPQNIVLGGPQNIVTGSSAGIVEGADPGIVRGADPGIVRGADPGIVQGADPGIVRGSSAGIVRGNNGILYRGSIFGGPEQPTETPITNAAASENVVPYSYTPTNSPAVPKWNPAGLKAVPTSK